ncbi:unnamed protein product, partial [Pylaiella littoralis]
MRAAEKDKERAKANMRVIRIICCVCAALPRPCCECLCVHYGCRCRYYFSAPTLFAVVYFPFCGHGAVGTFEIHVSERPSCSDVLTVY